MLEARIKVQKAATAVNALPQVRSAFATSSSRSQADSTPLHSPRMLRSILHLSLPSLPRLLLKLNRSTRSSSFCDGCVPAALPLRSACHADALDTSFRTSSAPTSRLSCPTTLALRGRGSVEVIKRTSTSRRRSRISRRLRLRTFPYCLTH